MGSEFGSKYRIEKELGKGGMGTVHLVTNLEASRLEALKTLSFNDERRVTRFKEEFNIISSLDSDLITKAYELNESPLFITMEYIEGQSLGSLIKDGKLPDYRQRLIWLKSVAQALQHIHSKKILFCDLSPGNIMLTKANQIKLIDFGISIRLGENPYSKPQGTVGTNYYMSPEQLKGDKLDYRSDLYSFGVVAYELLTGLKAFDSDPKLEGSQAAVTQIRMKNLIGKVPSVREKTKEISKSLDETLQICMQKDRNDRYNSINEVLIKIDKELGIEQGDSALKKLLGRFLK